MINKIKSQIIKDRKIIVAALLAGFVFTLGVTLITFAYSERMQTGIADSVLRFHVRANSNTAEDQLLKIEVKNAVLDSLYDGLPSMATKDETIAYIMKNIENITQVAQATIARKGYNHSVNAYITTAFFPTMPYGEIALPAGFYDALRIDIGAGTGENWWCVMFPPLCYVDLSVSELPQSERDALRYILTSGEYELITSRNHSSTDVSVRFKVVEWWQNRRAEDDTRATVVLR